MEPQNCWEFWNCSQEIRVKCPAYVTHSGKECYNLAECFCAKVKKDFKHCWECPWYLKINPKKK